VWDVDDLLTSAFFLSVLVACLLNGVAAVRWRRPYQVLPMVTTGMFIASVPCTYALMLLDLVDVALHLAIVSVMLYTVFSVLTTVAWLVRALIGIARRR
jgi:hypothetical protein